MSDTIKLADLKSGQRGTVRKLQFTDEMRRRLQDIGMVEGTDVECVGKSPFGDPGAYLVRKSVMALRREDSEKILIEPKNTGTLTVALAGNPNVGKSTVFNQLTGMRQHTGNWPGKTVASARGYCSFQRLEFELVDIPGCYSLMAHSAEEEVARDFICFEQPDAVVVVCDATCLERNLNLVLQILETDVPAIVCVNLMDEADKKSIKIDIPKLEELLHVPVVAAAARSKKGLTRLLKEMASLAKANAAGSGEPGTSSTSHISDASGMSGASHMPGTSSMSRASGEQTAAQPPGRCPIHYPGYIEAAVDSLYPAVKKACQGTGFENIRWLCARLLDLDDSLRRSMKQYLGTAVMDRILQDEEVHEVLAKLSRARSRESISVTRMKDDMASAFIWEAQDICSQCVCYENSAYDSRDRHLDKLFTSKGTGFLIMFLVLMGIFWLTITGANYPSQLLSNAFGILEEHLWDFLTGAGLPKLLCEALVCGVYRVLAWVISVMLPPMAIFFPLFTLLEDFGYLPRVAFNLDRCFQKCRTCGKQCLTMCMGFGCNAVGAMGCRIIDSPRERLVAMITNNFVPCNGRLPILITMISIFFVSSSGLGASLASAALLALLILLGILMTFLVSRILTSTILKGLPSSFTLELPPYRRPQVGKVVLRSIFDRTLFVLGRAAAVAAPAGLLLWLLANIQVQGATLLAHFSGFLDPLGRAMGMDGVILLAFILGFPANEIVIPIIIMAYMAKGSLVDIQDLGVLKQLLLANGWTWITAVSTMLFALMHWPCSTTCLTIKKESSSVKWMLLSILVPTICGILICVLFSTAARFFTGL